ncbi:MAG: glycogen debranching protein, partial [Bacteroidota bacterium]
MNSPLYILIPLLLLGACQSIEEGKEGEMPLYQSDEFTLFKDKVIQGDNVAEVRAPNHLVSNYKSPASTTFSRLVKFKFSINEKDNELPPGADHWVIIQDEKTAPLVTFGEQPTPFPEQPSTYLPTNYEYTFRVNVAPVLKQFETQGYYETHDGSKVAKAD